MKGYLHAGLGAVIRTVVKAHESVVQAAGAVLPPQFVLAQHAAGISRTLLLGAAANLRLADHLADGPLTAAELATRSQADEGAVHRTMRALVAIGIFELGSDGRFRNNRISKALCTDAQGSALNAALYWASGSNVAAWGDYLRTVRTGETAFDRVHGMSIWSWLRKNPQEAADFNRYMQEVTEVAAPAIAMGYPFAEIQSLCDVGGGRGTLLAGILGSNPNLRGILADAPTVLEDARAFLAERGMSERVELVPTDFFERVPEGVDAYLLKDILHDWDDARSIHILKAVRRAAKPDGRVLIVEIMVEPHDTEFLGTLLDVHMMAVCGGRQRSRDDFRNLFEASGFRLSRVVKIAHLMSVIEGVAI
ncbi:acetylserotonin O-methyltransferase [Pendulispora rubella]|uniref:Acetylserotonin O-methyltransferase n=1 Tax=Pendulispora rubella TaxID=2741070 RepID=A0ABZ2L7V0_9BACT